MSLDQVLGDAARRIAADVTPPDVDLGVVRRRARSRDRRRRATVVAAVAAAVVATGAVVVDGRPDSTPQPVEPVPTPTPSPTPTPTQDPTDADRDLTPAAVSARQVVRSAAAAPSLLGVAAGDLDARLAVWTLPDRAGAAVTTDGYENTSYVPVPWGRNDQLHVLSPTDDAFLLSHVNQGFQWLVGTDGTVRRVTRVRREVLPDDERLWFQCADDDGWRSTWCVLDPETARAFVWSAAWDGSAVPPGEGRTPWGANPEPRAVGSTGQLEVWWGSAADRQVRTLATAEHGDYVLGCPQDLMALWSVAAPGDALTLHTSTDGGATWQADEYAAPGADLWWRVRCAADGSFLAVDSERGVTVWHAEASDDSFRQVFAAAGPASTLGVADLWTVDGRAVVSSTGVVAVSDDSGRTWTRIEGWR